MGTHEPGEPLSGGDEKISDYEECIAEVDSDYNDGLINAAQRIARKIKCETWLS